MRWPKPWAYPAEPLRSRVFYALRSMKLALEERGVTA
ncbi:hypothetical protein SVIOM74S_04108 [Streptomyces violarus]